MRGPFLDEAYRAAAAGLQAGAAAAAAAVVLRAFATLCACCACLAALLPSAQTLFVVGALAGAAAALHVNAWRLPALGRGVLITGCDSGFGLHLALHLQALGCVVFAGCLDASGGEGVDELRSRRNVHVVQLDVTKDDQLRAAREYVQEHMPLRGLWGVVNNAGIFTFGHAEWSSVDIGRRVMDVNVFGYLRVAQTFLPLLRLTKGRLVNLGSVSGRQCAVNFTLYSMSKYSVEALSDSLRFEMRKFGIHVAVVEPGNFAASTRLFQEGLIRKAAADMWERLPAETKSAYGKAYFDDVIEKMITSQAAPTPHSKDISPVLASLEHALLAQLPAPRYHPSDLSFALRTWINTHGPEWLFELLYI